MDDGHDHTIGNARSFYGSRNIEVRKKNLITHVHVVVLFVHNQKLADEHNFYACAARHIAQLAELPFLQA